MAVDRVLRLVGSVGRAQEELARIADGGGGVAQLGGGLALHRRQIHHDAQVRGRSRRTENIAEIRELEELLSATRAQHVEKLPIFDGR